MRSCVAAVVIGTLLASVSWAEEWKPAKGPLATRWAAEVSPQNALPEYPRPQMVRPRWMNLNGLWDYAIEDRADAPPRDYQGKILVPFPPDAPLSGDDDQLTGSCLI